ncbi:MAG: glutamate--tRNA ligase, partial [Nocardioidaceae bacterium]|nr:glutamate--tRNA ligase [Nocardioidaceae bacterium]
MAPSPTGSPHVGLVRTALFNWAFARHHGGSFVLRIEDTDKERSTDESLQSILSLMRWLGLEWDEGPDVGGVHAPYFQSQRSDIYADALAKLKQSSFTYECYCTNEEAVARRKAAGSKVQGYDGFCRDLSQAQIEAFETEGRKAIVRFRMPGGAITWQDLVRGEVSFDTEFVPDFALCRANGAPLYTLVNPVDDALMEITHVLRGEDLLSSTPRQIALYEALKEVGIAQVTPQFGHLPYVMGQGNKKLSKRDPEADALAYRAQGYLPEGLINYLALLGWAIAADRDIFSLEEMVEAFEITDVVANPARFDIKKCDAINAAHLRLLSVEEATHRVLPFLKDDGVIADPLSDADAQLLEAAMPLITERIGKLSEASALLGFLFVEESDFTLDPADAAKQLGEEGRPVVQAAH